MRSNLYTVNKENLLALEKKCSQLIQQLADLSNICAGDGTTLNVSLLRHDEEGFLLEISKEEDEDLYRLLHFKVGQKLNQTVREIQYLASTISN